MRLVLAPLCVVLVLLVVACAAAPVQPPTPTSPPAAPPTLTPPPPAPTATAGSTAGSTAPLTASPAAPPTAAAPSPTAAGAAAASTGAATPARTSVPATAAPTGAATPAATAAGAAVPTTAARPAPTGAATPPPIDLPRAMVGLQRADGSRVDVSVEIAADQAARQRGLMFRPSLPADAGMLFVFPDDSEGPFWMKDTYVPLSIAFIAADGRIASIRDMQPRSTDLTYPGARYRYALEVNQGFFDRAGVRVGDRADLPH